VLRILYDKYHPPKQKQYTLKVFNFIHEVPGLNLSSFFHDPIALRVAQ
jgi:hypothetical protein